VGVTHYTRNEERHAEHTFGRYEISDCWETWHMSVYDFASVAPGVMPLWYSMNVIAHVLPDKEFAPAFKHLVTTLSQRAAMSAAVYTMSESGWMRPALAVMQCAHQSRVREFARKAVQCAAALPQGPLDADAFCPPVDGFIGTPRYIVDNILMTTATQALSLPRRDAAAYIAQLLSFVMAWSRVLSRYSDPLRVDAANFEALWKEEVETSSDDTLSTLRCLCLRKPFRFTQVTS